MVNTSTDALLNTARAAFAALNSIDRAQFVRSAEHQERKAAAAVILPIFEKLRAKLDQAGCPVSERVIIITSDGECLDADDYASGECPHCGMFPTGNDDDDDDDDDDDYDFPDGPVLEINGPLAIRRLKAYMLKNEVSSEDAAEELEVSLACVKGWLSGKIKNPREENRAMIHDYIGLPY